MLQHWGSTVTGGSTGEKAGEGPVGNVFLGRLAGVEALRLDQTGNRKKTEPKAVFSFLFVR